MNQAITSLGQFLTQIGVHARFYNLGRHISKISAAEFEAFEKGSIAYPTPYLHQAWLGLVFREEENDQASATSATIWFLRFPLDEQGKLLQPERDKFLQMLLSAVGTNLEAAKTGKQLQAVLEGNPYVFTPPPERQAAFHARIKVNLKLPASQYFDTAKYYLETAVHQDKDRELWQAVGLQGLADIAVRWNKKDIYTNLLNALPVLPVEPFASLCECLENEPVDAKIATAICQRLQQFSEAPAETANTKAIAAAVRGLSNSIATGMRRQALARLLSGEQAKASEVLVAMATRCGDDLIDDSLTLPFLEVLAQYPQDTFNRVMLDLLFQPHLRQAFLKAFRQPERSETLSLAIGALLNPGS